MDTQHAHVDHPRIWEYTSSLNWTTKKGRIFFVLKRWESTKQTSSSDVSNKSNRVNLGQLSYIYPVLKQLRTASLVHFYTSLHSKRGRSSRPLLVWFCFLLPMLGSDCPACQMVWNGFNWFSCANIDSTCCARVLLKQRSPLLISAA